jgi:hypothetical protein
MSYLKVFSYLARAATPNACLMPDAPTHAHAHAHSNAHAHAQLCRLDICNQKPSPLPSFFLSRDDSTSGIIRQGSKPSWQHGMIRDLLSFANANLAARPWKHFVEAHHGRISFSFVFCAGASELGNLTFTSTTKSPRSPDFLVGMPRLGNRS